MSEPQLARFGPGCGTEQAQGRHPHQKPPSEQRAPSLRYNVGFPGSLGLSVWNWNLSLPRRGPLVFRETKLRSRSPTPAKAEFPRENWGPGPRIGYRPWFHARWSGVDRSRPMPTINFFRGESGLGSTWVAKILALAQTPSPCSVAANVDRAATTP